MKNIVILGSTGSVGTQTLDVVRERKNEFRVLGISAHENSRLFEKQVKELAPKYAIQTAKCENPEAALVELATLKEVDVVVNALPGRVGLMPTYEACRAGKTIALANKESLVMGGELIMNMAKKNGARIIPIDSELSALWQVLPTTNIEKIILTASGGPFFGWPREQLENVTPKQALNHPTWKMGPKVSIDSATFMNKAFEMIEAHWLFGLPPEKIEVAVHRQSIVHAMVQFDDGSVQAVMSVPDMHIPIHQALDAVSGRSRPYFSSPRMDFSRLQLAFEKFDGSIFEGPSLVGEILRQGGLMPAILSIADEIAVRRFLDGELKFLEIYSTIRDLLKKTKNFPASIHLLQDLMK